MVNHVPRKPQIENASSAVIEIQVLKVALRTIFKIYFELRNYFLGEKVTVHEVGFPEESNMRGVDLVY